MSEHDKLAEAMKERDEALAHAERSRKIADGLYENYCKILKQINVTEKERDDAVTELKRLKKALECTAIQRDELLASPLKPETRPEPSRLEIAAMLMQGFIAGGGWPKDASAFSLKYADDLIAAAKEAK
jgi:uncharacterized coiled-coil DUF342 family protein